MVKTYDPGQHFINFLGIQLNGFADGTYLTVKRMSDAFSSVAGAGGEVARVRNRDKRGEITFSCLASSPVNDLLMAAALLDEESGAGVGVFSMMDGNGTTVVNAPNTWVKKIPDLEESKELPTREWTLECEDLDLFVGGNR